MEIFDRIVKSFFDLSFQKAMILMNYFKNEEAEIIDLNHSQLDEGVTSEDEKISPPYSPNTQKYSQLPKGPSDPVTLEETGEFREDFAVRFGEDWFAIYSEDDKTEKLEAKYGKDIFGLTEESKKDLYSLVRRDFEKEIRKTLLRI